MEGLEEYFINENELKENMAKGWDQIDVDKSTNTSPNLNPTKETKEKKSKLNDRVAAPTLLTGNKSKKLLLDYYFNPIPTQAKSESTSIRLSTDILSDLEIVSFFMKQNGKKQPLKQYIENILIQHLKDYENEITDLKNKKLFTKTR